ncbi:MAG: MgtC/SapB family protein, partial [Gammaproteobacteria bacterium]
GAVRHGFARRASTTAKNKEIGSFAARAARRIDVGGVMDSAVLGALSLALGLGLLIGLQRERVGSTVGGIRTFPLIALLGVMCGLLASRWSDLIVVAGFIGVTSMAVLANLTKLKEGTETTGQTTEVAALLTYALGAYLATKNYPVAIVIGGVTAVLLHSKEPMHQFAGSLSERDVQAVMRFVIISLIILPVLPDEAFGPHQVLNPREIWWMVVLIVGIGLAGYVSYKLFGGRAGVVLAGIFGGLISSTATTVALRSTHQGEPRGDFLTRGNHRDCLYRRRSTSHRRGCSRGAGHSRRRGAAPFFTLIVACSAASGFQQAEPGGICGPGG